MYFIAISISALSWSALVRHVVMVLTISLKIEAISWGLNKRSPSFTIGSNWLSFVIFSFLLKILLLLSCMDGCFDAIVLLIMGLVFVALGVLHVDGLTGVMTIRTLLLLGGEWERTVILRFGSRLGVSCSLVIVALFITGLLWCCFHGLIAGIAAGLNVVCCGFVTGTVAALLLLDVFLM